LPIFATSGEYSARLHKTPVLKRFNTPHKPFPKNANVYRQLGDSDEEAFEYESLLAPLKFDPANVEKLESRAALEPKPKPRGLQLRRIGAQPFDNLGHKEIGGSHEKQ